MSTTPSTHLVRDWLKEREQNARRIAEAKTGGDREGWLEDAAYFAAAASSVWESAELLAALKDILRIASAASIGVTGNQPRLDRARAAIAKAEGKKSSPTT